MPVHHVMTNFCHRRVKNLSHLLILVTDRRCTDERWVRDLLVDGCLTYEDHYWCMCSTDLCNSGDFASIRGMSINEFLAFRSSFPIRL